MYFSHFEMHYPDHHWRTVAPRNVWRGHEREWHDYATVPGPTSSSHTRLRRLSIIKNTWSRLKLLSHLAVLFHESLSRLHIASSHESNLRVLSLLLMTLIPRDLNRWSLKTERSSDFQSKPRQKPRRNFTLRISFYIYMRMKCFINTGLL